MSGKSIQVRKRKEELEFELDLVEKHIYRARQRSGIWAVDLERADMPRKVHMEIEDEIEARF